MKSSKRKTITVDKEVAETIKRIAEKRGMTINNYLKNLVEAVKSVEDMGFYAPATVKDASNILLLLRLGMVIVPPEILGSGGTNPEVVVSSGARIGKALRELGVNVAKVIELLGAHYRVVVPAGDRLIVVKGSGVESLLADVVKGVAKGGGLEVVEEEYATTIKQPGSRGQVNESTSAHRGY